MMIELFKSDVRSERVSFNCFSRDPLEPIKVRWILYMLIFKFFSLMVKSNLGSPTEALSEKNVVYLRPETCGGIYLEYKNIVATLHPKLPFGVAQAGKAFRNEIVARQFIFRTREFEQMEMQYFQKPEDMKKNYEMWKEIRWNWYLEYGIPADKIRWAKHEKLVHYASEAHDVEYNFASLGGFKEVEGIHARGNWDLTRHSKFSGVDLVVPEVFVGNVSVFITDKPVAFDLFRIEFDLKLNVLRDHLKGAVELVAKDLSSFLDAVDIVVVSVTFVGELLHHRVFVVAISEANRGHRDALRNIGLDLLQDLLMAGTADIGVPVRKHNHP